MSSSQLAIVQTYKVQTNGNSTASKAKKPSHGSHSISVYCNNTSANYCNIFAYLRITYNTSGACLNLPEWEPPSPEDQNGLIVGYTINITDLETGERYQHLSTSTNITIGSLTPFTTYICIIAARTNIGIGPFSTVVTVQTLEDGMCYCTFQKSR